MHSHIFSVLVIPFCRSLPTIPSFLFLPCSPSHFFIMPPFLMSPVAQPTSHCYFFFPLSFCTVLLSLVFWPASRLLSFFTRCGQTGPFSGILLLFFFLRYPFFPSSLFRFSFFFSFIFFLLLKKSYFFFPCDSTLFDQNCEVLLCLVLERFSFLLLIRPFPAFAVVTRPPREIRPTKFWHFSGCSRPKASLTFVDQVDDIRFFLDFPPSGSSIARSLLYLQ